MNEAAARRIARQPGPIGDVPVESDGERCSCGAGPHPEHEGRCAKGHALPNNSIATVVGHRGATFWTEHRSARRELQRRVVEDAGHTLDSAPEALRVASDGLAQAVLVRDSAFARVVEQGGPLTSSGRTRRAFKVWLDSTTKVENAVRLLGLKRQPKPAPSLEETLEQANNGGGR